MSVTADGGTPAEPGTPTILKRGGQRVGTVVMYLNEPARGGGTTFPDIGLEAMTHMEIRFRDLGEKK